jgi:hypothetical protein
MVLRTPRCGERCPRLRLGVRAIAALCREELTPKPRSDPSTTAASARDSAPEGRAAVSQTTRGADGCFGLRLGLTLILVAIAATVIWSVYH